MNWIGYTTAQLRLSQQVYWKRIGVALSGTLVPLGLGMFMPLAFARAGRIKNGVRALPGVDTRSAGGYVVAPPSLHPCGRTYRWIAGPGEAEIAVAPAWLVALQAIFAGPLTGGTNAAIISLAGAG